jgi:hypothetical protein
MLGGHAGDLLHDPTLAHIGAARGCSAAAVALDTNVFKVLIGQIRKNGPINPVISKRLRVLGHAEFFEPIRNLLHRGGVPTMTGLLAPEALILSDYFSMQ